MIINYITFLASQGLCTQGRKRGPTSISLSVRDAHLLSLSLVVPNDVDVQMPDNPHSSKNRSRLSLAFLRCGNMGFLETAHINELASFSRIGL